MCDVYGISTYGVKAAIVADTGNHFTHDCCLLDSDSESLVSSHPLFSGQQSGRDICAR